MAIQVTDMALRVIKRAIEAEESLRKRIAEGTIFLRIGVAGGGCSGLSYSLEWDSEPRPRDHTFEFAFPEDAETDPKLKAAVDEKSYLVLNGTTLDYTEMGLTGGFTFINPNAKSSCGCGQSFHA